MGDTRLFSEKRRIILQRQKNKCHYCRKQFKTAQMTVDHKIPKSKGGGNTWGNLVACCRECNLRKGNMSVDEFKQLLASREQKGSE